MARSNLDLAVATFAETTGSIVDGVGTFKNIVRASGDKLTVIRDQELVTDETAPPPGQ